MTSPNKMTRDFPSDILSRTAKHFAENVLSNSRQRRSRVSKDCKQKTIAAGGKLAKKFDVLMARPVREFASETSSNLAKLATEMAGGNDVDTR